MSLINSTGKNYNPISQKIRKLMYLIFCNPRQVLHTTEANGNCDLKYVMGSLIAIDNILQLSL